MGFSDISKKFFDIFKKDSRTKEEKLRDKAAKKIGNMFYQTADRVDAIEQMAEFASNGDERAVRILLSRFENLAPSTTVDRDEKQHVHDLLVDLGVKAKPIVQKYIKTTAKPVYWAMQVLRNQMSLKEYIAFTTEILSEIDPDYVRDPEKKIGLVQMAAEFADEELGKNVARFIEDHHEKVRFYAIESVKNHNFLFAKEILLRQLAEEESARILDEIFGVFQVHQWDMSAHLSELNAKMPDSFAIRGGKVVKK